MGWDAREGCLPSPSPPPCAARDGASGNALRQKPLPPGGRSGSITVLSASRKSLLSSSCSRLPYLCSRGEGRGVHWARDPETTPASGYPSSRGSSPGDGPPGRSRGPLRAPQGALRREHLHPSQPLGYLLLRGGWGRLFPAHGQRPLPRSEGPACPFLPSHLRRRGTLFSRGQLT